MPVATGPSSTPRGRWPASGTAPTSPSPPTRPPTKCCTGSTSGCTTTSGVARTMSCESSRDCAPRPARAPRRRPVLEALRAELVRLHAELPRHGLVVWTGGNVSARDPETGLVAIKASGVRYDDLTAASMVVVDLDGTVIEGDLKPSSDTASHLYIYRHRPD